MMPNVLTVGPTGKSSASVSETAIVSVYLDKRMPRRGAERFSGLSGKCRAKDTPDRGQRPRGWQRKGRAEARNASAEPRREVEQRSCSSFTHSKSLWSGAEAEGVRRQRCLGAQILDLG